MSPSKKVETLDLGVECLVLPQGSTYDFTDLDHLVRVLRFQHNNGMAITGSLLITDRRKK